MQKTNRFEYLPAVLLTLLGILFILLGVVRGEVDTVFHKAINICLECIGIG
ncbi:MAG: CD1871A family CXXC motif-containing protein [Lachnospiraceae bacterium]